MKAAFARRMNAALAAGDEPIDAAALSSTTPDGVPISDEMLIRDLLDRETDVVFKQQK